jgi:hypothetical protein
VTKDKFKKEKEQEFVQFEADELEAAGESLEDPESGSSLYPLPPGRFRSLGRHLDYTDWPDRERFVALDRELKITRTQRS